MSEFTIIKTEKGVYIKIERDIIDAFKLKLCLEKQGINHIVVSQDVTNLAFLQVIYENVKKFICVHKIKLDYSNLQLLINLEHLYIEDLNNQKLDFSFLLNLKYLNIKWNKNIVNLNKLNNLNHLEIRNYNLISLDEKVIPLRLQKLDLINGKLSTLSGLGELCDLKEIGLYYLKDLKNLNAIESCTKLESIVIENCMNIGNIDSFSKLINLQIVILENCGLIKSLLPLKNIDSIEFLRVLGKTKIIDGQVSFANKIKSKYIVGFLEN